MRSKIGQIAFHRKTLFVMIADTFGSGEYCQNVRSNKTRKELTMKDAIANGEESKHREKLESAKRAKEKLA